MYLNQERLALREVQMVRIAPRSKTVSVHGFKVYSSGLKSLIGSILSAKSQQNLVLIFTNLETQASPIQKPYYLIGMFHALE